MDYSWIAHIRDVAIIIGVYLGIRTYKDLAKRYKESSDFWYKDLIRTRKELDDSRDQLAKTKRLIDEAAEKQENQAQFTLLQNASGSLGDVLTSMASAINRIRQIPASLNISEEEFREELEESEDEDDEAEGGAAGAA